MCTQRGVDVVREFPWRHVFMKFRHLLCPIWTLFAEVLDILSWRFLKSDSMYDL
jgi:hypothetical protein